MTVEKDCVTALPASLSSHEANLSLAFSMPFLVCPMLFKSYFLRKANLAFSKASSIRRAFQLIRTIAPKQSVSQFPTRPEMCAQMQKSPSSSEKCSDLGRRYTKHASRQGREFPKRLYERTMLTGSRLQRNYMPSSLQPKLRHSPYECQRKAGVSH